MEETQITRKAVWQAYKNSGKDFIASTRTYESAGFLDLVGVDAGTIDTGIPSGALVARAGQVMNFFSYGRNSQFPGLTTATRFDDTNLDEAKKTNQNEDFVMESFSFSQRNVVVDLGSGKPTYSDADALAAVTGGDAAIYDPGAIIIPAALQSSLNNEDTLIAALQPHLTLTLKWGNREERIGSMDLIPGGAAKSNMRTNGVASPNDRYMFREGFLWRASGTDSLFNALATLARPVVIPYLGVRPQGQAAKTAVIVRARVFFKLRVHGIAFLYGSRN